MKSRRAQTFSRRARVVVSRARWPAPSVACRCVGVPKAGEPAGIGMPFGCRMGICPTCTLTLVPGKVRDLRNGDEFGQPNEPVQTCITAAVGDCTLDI